MKSYTRNKKWKKSGFTMAEILITVAIILILGAVATLAAVKIIRNTRQAASDKAAETIYTAVTNHLQEIWAFDYESVALLQDGHTALDVSNDTIKILYVAKNPGNPASGTDVTYVAEVPGEASGVDNTALMNIVLGENGSAISDEYYGDTVIVEFNPSSLQVYSVFYSEKITPAEFYTTSGSAANSLSDLRDNVSARKEEFKGYLGYYHSDTQNLPELSEDEYSATVGLLSEYSGDTTYHLRNLDELTVPVLVHFPETELSYINTLQFEITLTGVTSGASAKLIYNETDNTNGKVFTYYRAKLLKDSNKYADSKMFSFEISLDNLKDGTFNDLFCTNAPNPKTKIRFFGKNTSTDDDSVIQEKSIPITLTPNDSGDYFTAGEDIIVTFSSVKTEGVEKNISDDTNSATDNSIFAYGSGEVNDATPYYAAYLAYGRHLQNLEKSVSGVDVGKIKAYQVDDIDFTTAHKNYATKHDWLWADLYSDAGESVPYNSQRKFKPINNPDIEAFYGDYKLEYNHSSSEMYATSLKAGDYVGETEYAINGLVIKTTSDAGLFATFAGDEIKNVTLTNPRISGNGATGGFVARVTKKYNETLSIENCGIYMTGAYCDTYDESENPYGIIEIGAQSSDPDIQDDSDVYGIWMSGKKYAGGIVGVFSHDTSDSSPSGEEPALNLKNCFASTVIDTTDTSGISGGLIGFVGDEGSGTVLKTSITSSYSDSYIYGTDTAGLVGRIEYGNIVNLENVYTASIQDGTIQAGFANGTVNSAKTSYAFSRMSTDKNDTAFTTAAGITTADKVYYYPQYRANSGNAGKVMNATGTVNVEEFEITDTSKTTEDILLEKLGGGFVEDPGDTNPYNMRDGMALSTYTKPRLKNMIHYGDWEEEFKPGALVYYEQYAKSGSGVRFYGGNLNILYNNLSDGEAVTGDGYGIVFEEADVNGVLPDTVDVTYEFGDGTVTETIDLHTAAYYTSQLDDITYRIYPLAKENVNHVLTTDSEYYTKVSMTYKKAGTSNVTEAFYFNPHFARSVGYLSNADSEVPELKAGGVIYLRSARQLYNLSLYYKFYRTSTAGRTYRQTYDISYTDYDWNGFFNSNIPANNHIVRQNPIGISKAESFIAKYNGGCYKIRNISFVLEGGKNGGTNRYYTGLFGYNEGDLGNIVLYADYDESDANSVSILCYTNDIGNHYYVDNNALVHYYAGTDEDISKNEELYLGVLAGENAGSISNCAVAGYYMADSKGTIIANSNGYVYAGGLLGENTGTVVNSSADVPFIRLTTNYATAYVAGFVGRNTNYINNTYSLGHIEVVNPRGGSITLGGFASKNSGQIANSYAAVDIQSAGESVTYAFSPKGGSVSKCGYLTKGTYSYVGHLYSYAYANDTGAGSAKTRESLIKSANQSGRLASGNSIDYPKFADGEDYPYTAVVTDASGKYIHYGDWQREPSLGRFGVFYWEKEEGGDNSGYHFTYVGVDEQLEIAGTSLCNAHDDGGVIVDYGYGYYVKKGDEGTVTSTATGLNLPSESLSEVAAALEKEKEDYTFYPYRTLKNGASDKNNYIYLNYSGNEVASANNSTDICNGIWTLTKTNAMGSVSRSFYVAPFFANAISVVDPVESSLIVHSQDGVNTMDFVKKPGTTDNPYEIRTIEQLQYINWNATNQDVSTLVTGDANIYKAFPYLAYASVTGKGRQTKANAGHNQCLEFLQTHDVSGLDKDGNKVIENYTPIAPSFTASSSTSYTATLYNWFGSNYDGQSYKITNINISTKAFSVGVFGVTVSAGIKNVILYSDNDSVIERRNGSDLKEGGYSIGGLIGIAYKYAGEDATVNPIENCSVAGYIIKDESTNKLTRGESNVGGLIGATTVYVKNCSAVTDIEINCTHDNGHSTWGDYVRTGGLVGALPGAAINCYSGGSIKVGDATLAECRDRSGNVIDPSDETAVCDRAKSMNVYIGGIAGSAFSMNYQNFTNKTNNDDNSPTIKNCYCYVNFPDMEGSIRSITMMASLADRYCHDNESGNYTVYVTNSYYLGTFTQNNVVNAAKFRIYSENSHVATVSPYEALNSTDNFVYNNGTQADETLFENMVRGGGAYVSLITGYVVSQNHRIEKTLANGHTLDADIRPTAVTHSQLSGAEAVTVYDGTTYANIVEGLNSGEEANGSWGNVTTTQGSNNANIDGKYSFPGNNPTLDGLNYPFPTVVTQKDIVFGRTVYVHYGEWPLSGMYWAVARSEMDLFGDAEADGFAYKEIQVVEAGEVDLTTKDENGKYAYFEMEIAGENPGDAIVEIADVTKVDTDKYNVKFKALKTGTETITVGGVAKLILEVKANISFSVDPSDIKVSSAYVTGADAASVDLTLSASAYSTTTYEPVPCSDRVEWNVSVQDSDFAYIDGSEGTSEKTLAAGVNTCKITGKNPGRTQIIVKAVCTYNGTRYEYSEILPLQTYGAVGLSNNALSSIAASGVFWNEISRATSGDYVGADTDYSASATVPVVNDDGFTDLYIYESYADESLAVATITGIKINGNDVGNVIDDGTNKTYTSGNYVIDIGSSAENMSSDGNFRYRSLSVRPVSGNTGGEVAVEITLCDGDTDATYTLSGSLMATHVIHFDKNDGVYEDNAELGISSIHTDENGNIDLLGIIPTLKGYRFAGWATAADGAAEYCTGGAHDVNTVIAGAGDDMTLFAKWEPISYTITFDPGHGTPVDPSNLPAPIAAVYDTEYVLYDRFQIQTYYEAPNDTLNFVGWNTEADGSGISFKPGATIKNLAENDGDMIVLFAQWRDSYRLSFIDYKDGTVAAEKTGVDMSAGNTNYQTSAANLPSGATLDNKNGTYGYYWTSDLGTTYRFVGWDTNRKATSLNAAYLMTFDGGGNPVFPVITDIEGDSTFYVIWEEMGYQITLVDCLTGTDVSNTYTDLPGGLTGLSGITGYSAPSHTGYTFEGWYTDRISTGGEQFADRAGLFKQGKSIAELLSADGSDSITLYARYSEKIYVKLNTASPKNGANYLITITENGTSVGEYSGKFAYLLTDSTNASDFYSGNNPGVKDLVGIDHAFKTSSGNLYRMEEGSDENLMDSVVYMDEVSMPAVINRNRDRDNPINTAIPDNAIWTWNNGVINLASDPNKYLSLNGTHLVTGSDQGTWSYIANRDYFVLRSMDNTRYYLHCNYWNFNVSASNNTPTDKNFKVTLYEETNVYLDVIP